MTMKKLKVVLVVSALFAPACGETKQTAANSAKGSGSGTGEDASSGSGTGPEGSSGGDDTTGTGSAGGAEVLGAWCKKAGETKSIKDHMSEVFGRLCDGASPTKFFASTLIKNAYAGSGTPKLQDQKLKTDGPNTTADFGVGLKIPLSCKDHFAKVGPKAGEDDSVKKIAAATGATAEGGILTTYKKGDDKYLERGWLVHSKTSKKVLIVTKVQDSNSDSMQYDFDEGGKAFMYAQYIVKAIEGVSAYNLLTACVEVSNVSYLLTVAHVTVDNTPGGKLAEPTIVETAQAVAKFQYSVAKDAK